MAGFWANFWLVNHGGMHVRHSIKFDFSSQDGVLAGRAATLNSLVLTAAEKSALVELVNHLQSNPRDSQAPAPASVFPVFGMLKVDNRLIMTEHLICYILFCNFLNFITFHYQIVWSPSGRPICSSRCWLCCACFSFARKRLSIMYNRCVFF